MKTQNNIISMIGSLISRLGRKFSIGRKKVKVFPGSDQYWEQRYASGGHSGAGSYSKFAEFKAQIINDFVMHHGVASVIEFGCGDGNQLSLANYPCYTGFDISRTIINKCKQRFGQDGSKAFKLMNDYEGETAELALSLDVIYHLVEDGVFDAYMRQLFKAAMRYVIIYSSDSDNGTVSQHAHIRHRNFSKWIRNHISGWRLIGHIPNKYPYTGDYLTGSFADFYIYERDPNFVC